MNEKTLLRVSVISVIIGLAVLYILSGLIDINDSKINGLGVKDIDKTVSVKGIVSKVASRDKFTVIDVTQRDSMSVVVFDTNLSVAPGDEVKITGKVTEFNGDYELLADRIVRV